LADEWVTWLIVAGLLFVLAATPLAGPLTPFDPDFTQYSTGPWHVVIKPLLYGLCALALLVPLTLSNASSPYATVLALPGMRWLGRISYGIFLWHLVLLGSISSALGIGVFSGWFWLLWPLTLIFSVAVAWVSWTGLERRFISWSTRFRPGPPAQKRR
jgi:peptidoglycan/LPS O-acetylase OafA/YrhL